MKKVLIVSFFFPPFGGIAATRVGKHAKYLTEFGWEPVVLTAAIDENQANIVPVEVDPASIVRASHFSIAPGIYRNLEGEPSPASPASPGFSWKKAVYKTLRLFRPVYNLSIFQPLLLDPVGWYFPAVKKGREILEKQRIDAIFSSYSPSTSHFVASKLQKISKLPWVAEFRDLWALNPYVKTSKLLKPLECRMEKRVMRNCSSLVTVSEPLARQLQALHDREVNVITNGFDEEDYQQGVTLAPKFTITYTGNIYPGKQDPTPLFEAARDLKAEGVISADNFEICFYGGNTRECISPLVAGFGLEDLVKVYGLVPFRESVMRQRESTVLLLLEWTAPLAKGIYTGKIFEYLGARRPVLAIAYQGYEGSVVGDLLAESGTGTVASNKEQVREVMYRWLEEWGREGKISSHWQPVESVIRMYTRREQSRRLAQVLDRLV